MGSQIATAVGGEWIARLQGSDAVMSQQNASVQQIISKVDDLIPEAKLMQPAERLVLVERLQRELDVLKLTIVKTAFGMVCTHVEELRSLRTERKQLVDNLARMNKSYMQELAAKREQLPPPTDEARVAIGKAKKEVASPGYEPLAHLPEELRSTVLAILEDKLQAVFAFNPALKDQVNPVQMAKLEDSFRKERLTMLEKQQAQLKNENKDLKQRIAQLEAAEERYRRETAQAQAKLEALQVAFGPRQGTESPSSGYESASSAPAAPMGSEGSDGRMARPPSGDRPRGHRPRGAGMLMSTPSIAEGDGSRGETFDYPRTSWGLS